MNRRQLEQRRMAAALELQAGAKQAEVARRYGVSEASASRWARALREGGRAALEASRGRGGPEPRLSPGELRRLLAMLARGAKAHGWSTDLWTTGRVAELIRREFGVQYHYNHVGKVLKRLGLSWQKPRRRAKERDEGRRAEWLRSTWARVKKT